MRILLLMAALMAVLGLAACSTPPRSTGEAQSPAVAGKTSEASASAHNAVAQADERAFEPPPGFRLQTVDGQEVYCRKVVVLGSRFPKRVCMSQSQLEDMERGNQAMRDSMSQSNGICGSSIGCGGD